MMSRFSRFDAIVWLFLLSVGLLTGFIIWRGDQIGVNVIATVPASAATAVSSRSHITLTFDEPLTAVAPDAIRLEPATPGQTTHVNNQLIFVPDTPLTANTTYQVTLSGNVTSEQGRRLKRPFRWQFQTGTPRILYLSWQDEGRTQIYVAAPDTAVAPQPLTSHELGVLDFALAPDASSLVYAVFRADGGTDLWQMALDGRQQRLLLDCAQASCSSAVWSPNGRRLIYERRNIPEPNAVPGAPRLWWLDPRTGQTSPLFQDSQLLGLGVRFASDGQWISFVAPTEQGIRLYNLDSGAGQLISNQMGSPPVWQPDSHTIVLSDIQLGDGSAWAVHLQAIEAENGRITPLSGAADAQVDDGTPQWSPTGDWLAFGRKEPRTATGRQLWLMRPDGSDAHPLTAEPKAHHGAFVWSDNGRTILMQRYSLTELYADPGIWLYDTETAELRLIASPGAQPIAWIP